MSSMLVDDETLWLATHNCAGAYRTWVERLGKRTRVWDDLSCADLELPVALPPNGATLLRQPDDDVLERIVAFYAERVAGPYEIWSLWPIPGLAEAGTPSEPVPCMIRDPGGSAPRPPAELAIIEAHDQTTVGHADGRSTRCTMRDRRRAPCSRSDAWTSASASGSGTKRTDR